MQFSLSNYWRIAVLAILFAALALILSALLDTGSRGLSLSTPATPTPTYSEQILKPPLLTKKSVEACMKTCLEKTKDN